MAWVLAPARNSGALSPKMLSFTNHTAKWQAQSRPVHWQSLGNIPCQWVIGCRPRRRASWYPASIGVAVRPNVGICTCSSERLTSRGKVCMTLEAALVHAAPGRATSHECPRAQYCLFGSRAKKILINGGLLTLRPRCQRHETTASRAVTSPQHLQVKSPSVLSTIYSQRHSITKAATMRKSLFVLLAAWLGTASGATVTKEGRPDPSRERRVSGYV